MFDSAPIGMIVRGLTAPWCRQQAMGAMLGSDAVDISRTAPADLVVDRPTATTIAC
jgi:hypothetical protein